MKVLLIDPISTGGNHAAWNATLIRALAGLESVSLEILLADDQLAGPYFRTLASQPSVHATPIPTTHFPGALSQRDTLAQLWRGYRLLFRTLRRTCADIVVVLAAENTLTPLLLNAIAAHRLIAPNRTFVFFHSNLEQLAPVPWKRRLWRRCLRMSDTTAIVLAPFLEPTINLMMPGIKTRVLPNPTYGHLEGTQSVLDSARSSRADFIFVGRHASEALSTGFLREFLECCSRHAVEPSRPVRVAVPEGTDILSPDPRVILRFYPNNTGTSEYLSLIAESRFAVVSDKRATEFKTSGIIADLLTVGTPFIAPNLGVWSWQSAAANADLLFTGPDDLPRAVGTALSLGEADYARLRAATIRCGEQYSLGATAITFANILGVARDAHVH